MAAIGDLTHAALVCAVGSALAVPDAEERAVAAACTFMAGLWLDGSHHGRPIAGPHCLHFLGPSAERIPDIGRPNGSGNTHVVAYRQLVAADLLLTQEHTSYSASLVLRTAVTWTLPSSRQPR